MKNYTLAINNNLSFLIAVLKWWPIIVGLTALYIPTYYSLFTGIWKASSQAHGPIVLFIVIYLFWEKRDHFRFNSSDSRYTFIGSIILVIGILVYLIGRSLEVILLDVGSQVFVFSGVLLLTHGIKTLKALSFPLFFILFMVPVPGYFLDAVTMPMKMAVSYAAEQLLYFVGLPIARSGVILHIGQFQLLVADACAGLQTLISLEALGLLYLNLVKHDSFFRNISLAILIIPISFTANVIRVIILTIITYFFGNAAGQGFIHGFAGMVLFLVALILIITVDTILQSIAHRWR